MLVLIADDESNVRYALRSLLEERQEYRVVTEALDAEKLLAQTQAVCPDLVLLDWELPGLAAGDMLVALRELCPNLWIIVLSGRPEERVAALAAGADAFVSKMDYPEQLLAVIDGCRGEHQAFPGDARAAETQRSGSETTQTRRQVT